MDNSAGTLFRTLDAGDMVNALAWSPDSSRIVVGGEGTTVNVYSVGGGDPLARFPVGRTDSVAFSPNGQAIGVADDQQVAVHLASDGSAMWAAAVLPSESVSSVAFSPDGKLVLAATETAVGVFDAAGGTKRSTITIEEQLIARIDISRDSTQVLLAVDHNHGGNHRDAGSARVVDIASGKEVCRLIPADQTDAAVHTAVFTVDGRSVLCSRTDSTCRFFDAATGVEAEQSKIDHFAEDLAVDPTGQWLALATAESAALVVDADGVTKASAPHDGAVMLVAFSPNGRWVASAGADNLLHVHNVETDADRYEHDDLGEVRAMAFSPDSKWLALAIGQTVVVLDNGLTGAQP
jgi:WD40 repeat protein